MENKNHEWFKAFFRGPAQKIWERAADESMTEAEADFLFDELGCETGFRLLDVPCGNGRHAAALAKRGLKIVGVDLNPPEPSRAVGLYEHIEGDMRKLPFKAEFDGAYCFGNSFAYFDAADTTKFLQGVANALKPGACFALDTNMAAETVLLTGGEKEWIRIDDTFMLVDSHYEPETSRLHSKFVFLHDGKQETQESTHWIFTVGEISRMLTACGLKPIRYYSSTEGDFFELGDERLVLVAQKI